MKLPKKKVKGLIAHTNARMHAHIHSITISSILVTTFPPPMHLSEILRPHVLVRAVESGKENVADRNRT